MTTTTRAAATLILILSAASCAAAAEAGEEAGERWAVLVAGSNNWYNYRHQADVCHAYQILSRNGFPEDRIILMRYDDLEYNPLNPLPGAVINTPDCVPTDKDENGKWVLKKGCNVNENCPKHYFGAAVSPEAFLNILRGDQDQATKLCDDINADPAKFGGCNAKVLNSTASDDVFVAFFDHGGTRMIGFPPAWQYGPMRYVTAKELMLALQHMHRHRMYKEMVMYIEACESGSMFNGLLPKNVSIWAATASDPFHSSYATACTASLGEASLPCLADAFSLNWLEDVESHETDADAETFEDDFVTVESETTSSQVCAYGEEDLARRKISDFLGIRKPPAPSRGLTAVGLGESEATFGDVHVKKLCHKKPVT